MSAGRVVIIGAGMAGLTSALLLAARGVRVDVIERAPAPGGKMRELKIGNSLLDAGPTVLTMRWVLDEIFAAADSSLAEHVTLQPASILARHAWNRRERLDLYADIDRSAEAIGDFAGAGESRRFLEFSERARRTYQTLENPFIRSPRGNPMDLARKVGLDKLGELWRISPFTTLWRALGDHFHDKRLRQLFGRYATYCGSSPFLAPATLMLVAHVERDGVWLVQGGMHRLAVAVAKLAATCGAKFHYGTEATEVVVKNGRTAGVKLATGEFIDAHAVIVNADVAAVAKGLFGRAIGRAVPATNPSHRSLSALTWNLVAKTEGFPLIRHSIFFSGDYAAEFDDIYRRKRLPEAPTVYVCAQDRDDRGDWDERPCDGPERLFCLVNAPPTGDTRPPDSSEILKCEQSTFEHLERCGLSVNRHAEHTLTTTPADFHRLFPATGGALYGQASHGWMASFRRPGTRTKIRGLYLAGGSTHPGPGVPMAALSGQLAARSLLADFGSIGRSPRAAMPGGTSMR
jgi:1-hydroxycarotenoid 3,4-desaturase